MDKTTQPNSPRKPTIIGPENKPVKISADSSKERKVESKEGSTPREKASASSNSEIYGVSHGGPSGNVWVLDLCEKIISDTVSIQECLNQYEDHLSLKEPLEEKLTEEERAAREEARLKAVMVPPKREKNQYTEENIEKASSHLKSHKRYDQKN